MTTDNGRCRSYSLRELSSGRNVFEELGAGFTLLAFDAQDDAVEAYQSEAKSMRVPLK